MYWLRSNNSYRVHQSRLFQTAFKLVATSMDRALSVPPETLERVNSTEDELPQFA